jgi:predicted metalloprotease
MTNASLPPSRPRGRASSIVIAAALVLIVGALVGLWYMPGPLATGAATRLLGAEQADAAARRVTAVFENVQSVWRRPFAARLGKDYREPELRLYSNATISPCSDGKQATGPFYCPASIEAVFDLAFFETLNARLRRSSDLGTALVVALIAASHVQDQLGLLADAEHERRATGGGHHPAIDEALAAQADCLAGVWAALAAGSVGVVPPGFYDQLIGIARNVMDDRSALAPDMPSRLDPFAAASRETREADFTRGYAAGAPAACIPPDTLARDR